MEKPAIVVGGLQGPASAYKRAVIDATRALYGLRPKDAALLAIRAFARALGFEVVHAICDANHVLRRLQDTAQLSRYDDYWLERGGRRGGPFGFVFGPLEATAPSGDRRDATKAAVVAGMEAFVAARRAPPRAPDRDLCAQTPDLLSPNLSDVLPYVRTTLPSLLRALLSQSGRLLRHLDSPKLPVAPGDFSAFRLLDRSTSAISDCLRTIASKAPSQLAVTNLDAPAASI